MIKDEAKLLLVSFFIMLGFIGIFINITAAVIFWIAGIAVLLTP